MDYINKQIVNERGSIQVVEGTLTDGSKVYDVQFRVDGVLVTFDCDGPEQADRLMIEMDKTLGMKAVTVDKENALSITDHNVRFPGNLLVMDNPNLHFTNTRTPEVSIHNVQDVVLSGTHIKEDEIYGTVVWRNMNILQEVKKNGTTEIRRVNLVLFSDDKDKVKMGRGNITHSIHEQTRLQIKKEKEERV